MAASRVTSLSPAKAEITGFPFSIKFTWNTERESQYRALKSADMMGLIQCQARIFHEDRIYEIKLDLKPAYNIVKIFRVPYIFIHNIFSQITVIIMVKKH